MVHDETGKADQAVTTTPDNDAMELADDVVEGESIEVADPPTSTSRVETIDHKQEKTRAGLALWLMVIFAGTVAATFLVAFFATGDVTWATLEEILKLLIPAEVALLGSALGFYFGTRSNN